MDETSGSEANDDPNELVSRLIASNLVTMTIRGLHKYEDGKRPYGQGSHQATLQIPGSAGVDQVKAAVFQAGMCYIEAQVKSLMFSERSMKATIVQTTSGRRRGSAFESLKETQYMTRQRQVVFR